MIEIGHILCTVWVILLICFQPKLPGLVQKLNLIVFLVRLTPSQNDHELLTLFVFEKKVIHEKSCNFPRLMRSGGKM